MAEKLAALLADGSRVSLALGGHAAEDALERFKDGIGDLGQEWVEAEDGAWVRRDAVVAVNIVAEPWPPQIVWLD